MEEPQTKNHKFINCKDYHCDSVPATKEEIDSGREKFKKTRPEDVGMRSCYECNHAHYHLMHDFTFRCYDCGRIFVDGVDIMDYEK